MNGDDDSGEKKTHNKQGTHKLQTLIQTVVCLLLFLSIFLSMLTIFEISFVACIEWQRRFNHTQFAIRIQHFISNDSLTFHFVNFLHFNVDTINRNDIQYTAYSDRLYLT